MGHTIERATANLELTDLRRPAPRTQPIFEDCLETKDRRLRQRPTMIARFTFPLRTPLTSNGPQILITGQRRRTQQDWAWAMQELVDVHYPEAERITVVLDNLNTHTGAALYRTFRPTEARRILERLELHYTPKHGSWLNMAEIELSVLTRQCLERRLADRDTVQREVAAWEAERNQRASPVDWQFTTADARTKLKRLYPVIRS
jgi:transposase